MAEIEGEVPKYLKAIQDEGTVAAIDNFGPEDVLWTGENGEVDPEDFVSEFGFDPESPLELLLKSLILGHTPHAAPTETAKRLRDALSAITGKPANGRPPKDDNDALLEIAWQSHVAKFNAPAEEKLNLRRIVTSVVGDYFPDVHTERNIQRDSYIEKLEDKFNKDKDLYLSRATMNNDWNRMDDLRKLKEAISILRDLGVSVDSTAVRARLLRSFTKSPRDETPTG